jgi:ketosteroid isomerase-like protein
MKYIILTFFVAISFLSTGQNLENPNLQAMLEQERAFSAMAMATTAREAFHAYLSEHAVTFEKEPRIGLKHFETQIPNSSLLSWQPEFCDLAASGDFGYITGPWQLRTERTDREPAVSGHFVSVWVKQPDGKWKVALDIGVSHAENNRDTVTVTTSAVKAVKVRKGDFHAVTEIEEKFITNFEDIGNKAYETVASEELRLYRTGKLPIRTAPDIAEYIKTETAQVDYLVVGGALSKSKDLAYVYGTATIKISKDQHITTNKACYVRIWKKEDGDHWKIVVDILSEG